ncbi:MAG: hypothetical protein Q7R93_03005 [bacterium]|nr:hypothetical protein [bacterium]
MKRIFLTLVVLTTLFLSWVGVSDACSLRDVCGDLSYYARHPSCITETVSVVSNPPEAIWSGWALKVRAGTLYVSHAVPALTLFTLWVLVAVLGICSFLSCFTRKE